MDEDAEENFVTTNMSHRILDMLDEQKDNIDGDVINPEHDNYNRDNDQVNRMDSEWVVDKTDVHDERMQSKHNVMNGKCFFGHDLTEWTVTLDHHYHHGSSFQLRSQSESELGSQDMEEHLFCNYCDSRLIVGSKIYHCNQENGQDRCNYNLCCNCMLDFRLHGGFSYKQVSEWIGSKPRATKKHDFLEYFKKSDVDKRELEKIDKVVVGLERFIDSLKLENFHSFSKFMTHVVSGYITRVDIGNTNKLGELLEDALTRKISSDIELLHSRINECNIPLSIRYFSSNTFLSDLQWLHFMKIDLKDIILSPYGRTMKRYNNINPPNSTELEWRCFLCRDVCDMYEWNAPKYYYWCSFSRTLLCPAHASGGAPAQNQLFVHESKYLLDLIKLHRFIRDSSKGDKHLREIWTNSTNDLDENTDFTTAEQFENLGVGLIEVLHNSQFEEENRSNRNYRQMKAKCYVTLLINW